MIWDAGVVQVQHAQSQLVSFPAAGRANACRSVAELLAAPEVAALLAEGAAAAGCGQVSGCSDSSGSPSSSDSSAGSSSDGSTGADQQRRRKLVLVFGREVEGLLDHEVDACDYTLSIPIGRLQGGQLLSPHLPLPIVAHAGWCGEACSVECNAVASPPDITWHWHASAPPATLPHHRRVDEPEPRGERGAVPPV